MQSNNDKILQDNTEVDGNGQKSGQTFDIKMCRDLFGHKYKCPYKQDNFSCYFDDKNGKIIVVSKIFRYLKNLGEEFGHNGLVHTGVELYKYGLVDPDLASKGIMSRNYSVKLDIEKSGNYFQEFIVLDTQDKHLYQVLKLFNIAHENGWKIDEQERSKNEQIKPGHIIITDSKQNEIFKGELKNYDLVQLNDFSLNSNESFAEEQKNNFVLYQDQTKKLAQHIRQLKGKVNLINYKAELIDSIQSKLTGYAEVKEKALVENNYVHIASADDAIDKCNQLKDAIERDVVDCNRIEVSLTNKINRDIRQKITDKIPKHVKSQAWKTFDQEASKKIIYKFVLDQSISDSELSEFVVEMTNLAKFVEEMA